MRSLENMCHTFSVFGSDGSRRGAISSVRTFTFVDFGADPNHDDDLIKNFLVQYLHNCKNFVESTSYSSSFKITSRTSR